MKRVSASKVSPAVIQVKDRLKIRLGFVMCSVSTTVQSDIRWPDLLSSGTAARAGRGHPWALVHVVLVSLGETPPPWRECEHRHQEAKVEYREGREDELEKHRSGRIKKKGTGWMVQNLFQRIYGQTMQLLASRHRIYIYIYVEG